LEAVYSERGAPQPHCRVPLKAHPRNAPAIQRAGFQVASFASNHTLDWGADAALDTLDVMRKTGVHIIGVGKNIAEAREPKIMECRGTNVAFLAYCSILPMGCWAEANKFGCAPARGWTFYEQIEHDQPGTPARIHSFAHEDDQAAMIKDINNVKAQADLVMVSMHWGIHFKEAEIAAYQKEYAYAACLLAHPTIDAVIEIKTRHHPKLEEIREVICEVSPLAADAAGIKKPKTGLEGKFSLPFCAVIGLTEGRAGESQFQNHNVEDLGIKRLMEKVTLVSQPKIPVTTAVVQVVMANGESYRKKIDYPQGHPNNPLLPGQLEEKFKDLTVGVLGETKAFGLLKKLNKLEEVSDINELIAFCF